MTEALWKTLGIPHWPSRNDFEKLQNSPPTGHYCIEDSDLIGGLTCSLAFYEFVSLACRVPKASKLSLHTNLSYACDMTWLQEGGATHAFDFIRILMYSYLVRMCMCFCMWMCIYIYMHDVRMCVSFQSRPRVRKRRAAWSDRLEGLLKRVVNGARDQD